MAAGCADRADREVVTCGIASARKKKEQEFRLVIVEWQSLRVGI